MFFFKTSKCVVWPYLSPVRFLGELLFSEKYVLGDWQNLHVFDKGQNVNRPVKYAPPEMFLNSP